MQPLPIVASPSVPRRNWIAELAPREKRAFAACVGGWKTSWTLPRSAASRRRIAGGLVRQPPIPTLLKNLPILLKVTVTASSRIRAGLGRGRTGVHLVGPGAVGARHQSLEHQRAREVYMQLVPRANSVTPSTALV